MSINKIFFFHHDFPDFPPLIYSPDFYFTQIYTYIAGETFVLFHEAFVLLVDFENFADAVRGRFSL